METPEGRIRNKKGGDIVIFEHQGLKLVNADPTIRVSFEQVGCIKFSEKLQGYNMQVEKEFALSFDGIRAKVGNLQLQVSEDTIVVATQILAHGEQWFKGMQLDLSYYHDFLKLESRNTDFGATIPRELLLEIHSNLLRVIQSFFTCEGRFTRVYQYHIRILMHFTGKKPLNLPYYLFRSLGKMADRVQVRIYQGEPSLFHFSLIKLFVLEELRKMKQDWEFL
jgi:hypothetical protein